MCVCHLGRNRNSAVLLMTYQNPFGVAASNAARRRKSIRRKRYQGNVDDEGRELVTEPDFTGEVECYFSKKKANGLYRGWATPSSKTGFFDVLHMDANGQFEKDRTKQVHMDPQHGHGHGVWMYRSKTYTPNEIDKKKLSSKKARRPNQTNRRINLDSESNAGSVDDAKTEKSTAGDDAATIAEEQVHMCRCARG